MKITKSIKFIFIIVLIAGLAFLFLANPLFKINFGFFRSQKTAISKYILEIARPVFSLQTLECSMQIAFPYDYMPEKKVYAAVAKKIKTGEELDQNELAVGEFIHLMNNLGFTSNPNDKRFAIISVKARVGYDLNGYYDMPERDFINLAQSMISVDQRGRKIFFSLPRPKIVEVIIEDPTVENYEYPDISLSPAEWKLVAAFVKRRILEDKADLEIIEEAYSNAKQFLKEVLLAAGWNDVIFESLSESATTL